MAKPAKGRTGGTPTVKTALAVVGIVLAVAIGSYLLYSQWRGAGPANSTPSSKGAAVMRIDPRLQNLGQVRMSEGIVTTTFEIVNGGKGDLIINNMETSCDCTRASLIVNGKEGPSFGMSMHGTNPRGWKARIAPGQAATLKVAYDPNAHGYYVGEVVRVVYIYSNDALNPIAQLRIEADQIE